MNKLRFWIRQYFGFSQRETSGFLVLLVLMAMFLILPFFIKPKPEIYNPTHDRQILDSLTAVLDAREEIRRSTFYAKKPTVSGGFRKQNIRRELLVNGIGQAVDLLHFLLAFKITYFLPVIQNPFGQPGFHPEIDPLLFGKLVRVEGPQRNGRLFSVKSAAANFFAIVQNYGQTIQHLLIVSWVVNFGFRFDEKREDQKHGH